MLNLNFIYIKRCEFLCEFLNAILHFYVNIKQIVYVDLFSTTDHQFKWKWAKIYDLLYHLRTGFLWLPPSLRKHSSEMSYVSDFVSLCLVSPFLLCPNMVLPVSCSLWVQLVPALCPDYVPGVSSFVSLFIVCSATCFRLVNVYVCVDVNV